MKSSVFFHCICNLYRIFLVLFLFGWLWFWFGICLWYSANKKRSIRTENRWKIIGQNNKERFSLTPEYLSASTFLVFHARRLMFGLWIDRNRHTYSMNKKSKRKIATNSHTIITIFFNPANANITTPFRSICNASHSYTHSHTSNKYKLANKCDGITMTESNKLISFFVFVFLLETVRTLFVRIAHRTKETETERRVSAARDS